MASLQAITGVDIVLAAGGVLLLILGALIWRVEANTRDSLRSKRFDNDTNASLERMYLEENSFRGMYNAMHEVINQPPFMVAGMTVASVFAILVGYFYVTHPDTALSFIVLVFIIGLVWYFGDALESTLVVSFASRSSLRKSDRDNVGRYQELVRLGKYYLLALGVCLLAASSADAAGLVTYVSRPFGVVLLVLAFGLAFLAAWRSTLAANRPIPG